MVNDPSPRMPDQSKCSGATLVYFRVFDCWRFAAALLVMAYHFLYWAPVGSQAGTDFLFRLLPLLDSFFMISGFFIMSRYGERLKSFADYRDFFRRRVARLYPLHFAATMFFAVIAVGAFLAGAKHYDWALELSNLPQNLLAIHALGTTHVLALNYVSWSVSAEFFSYALFPLILLAFRKRGLPGLTCLFVVWIAGLEVASAMGVFPSGSWTSADTLGAYRTFADFTAGAVIAVLVQRRVMDIRSLWPGLVLMALAVGGMIAGFDAHVSLVFMAASLLAIALAETADPDSTAVLAFAMPVTRVAFGIYLLHPVMEFFFFTVLWQRWLGPRVALDGTVFYAYWMVPMLATIAIAMASERWYERKVGGWIAGPKPKVARDGARDQGQDEAEAEVRPATKDDTRVVSARGRPKVLASRRASGPTKLI